MSTTRTISLPDDLAQRLQEHLQTFNLNVSAVCAEALRETMKRNEALVSEEPIEQRIELENETVVFDGEFVGEDDYRTYYRHVDGNVVVHDVDHGVEKLDPSELDLESIDPEIAAAFGLRAVRRI